MLNFYLEQKRNGKYETHSVKKSYGKKKKVQLKCAALSDTEIGFFVRQTTAGTSWYSGYGSHLSIEKSQFEHT